MQEWGRRQGGCEGERESGPRAHAVAVRACQHGHLRRLRVGARAPQTALTSPLLASSLLHTTPPRPSALASEQPGADGGSASSSGVEVEVGVASAGGAPLHSTHLIKS
eukprot:714293-Rhodomonas_salina.2